MKTNLLHKLEIPFVMLSLFAGAAFLTKMCAISHSLSTRSSPSCFSRSSTYTFARGSTCVSRRREKRGNISPSHNPITVSPPLGYRLPLKLTAFFAGMTVFSLSAAYEIIELWDELYFGGKRIWGPYDTATDLQWDLCGIIVGTLFSCIMLRTFQPVYKPALEQS